MVRMTKLFGPRGVVLALFGIPWIAYGFAVVTTESSRFSDDDPGGSLSFLDHPYWGYLWIAAGFFAIVSMFVSRWVPVIKDLAYGFFTVPIALWTFGYTASWLIFESTGGEMGRDRAYLGLIIFGNFLVMVLYLARNLRDVEVD